MDWKHKTILGLTPTKETYFSHPVRGLRLRVYPTKSGHSRLWEYSRSYQGQPFARSFGPFPEIVMSDAVEMAVEANANLVRHGDPFYVEQIEIGDRSLTVAEAWERHEADRRRTGKRFKTSAKVGETYIVRYLGDLVLTELTTDHIRSLIARPLRSNRRGSTGGLAMSNQVLRITKSFLTWCADETGDGFRDFIMNPARSIKPTDEGVKRRRTLSMSEMARVVLAGRTIDQRRGTTWGDIMMVLCLTGCRKSEVISMRKSEWVSAEQVWNIPEARMKTGVYHVLPVGPTVSAIFDRLSALPGHFMFPNQFAVRRGNDDFRACAEMLEVEPMERWTLHATRYGCRTNMRKEKICDSAVAERIIHPTKAQSYDWDFHDEMREALVAWDARLNQEIRDVLAERMTLVG